MQGMKTKYYTRITFSAPGEYEDILQELKYSTEYRKNLTLKGALRIVKRNFPNAISVINIETLSFTF